MPDEAGDNGPSNTDENENSKLDQVIDWMLGMEELTQYAYPCTVIPARYGGAYEGGAWLAFNCRHDGIPNDATGSDNACEAFWDAVDQGILCYPFPYPNYGKAHLIIVGKGPTPNIALAELIKKLERQKADT